MTERFDALIVGAGVAGSACAILLARCGWNVALVERQTFPRSKVCGECLGAASFALLDALDVGEAVRAIAGPPLKNMVLMHGKRCTQAALPAALAEQGWSRCVGREELDTLLVAQAVARGVTLFQPWALIGVQGGVGNWQCELQCSARGGPAQSASTSPSPKRHTTVNADVLIDAHGSWETQQWRARLHEERTTTGAQLLAFKAHFANSSVEGGTLPVLMVRGGYGGMVLGAQGLTTLACCIRRDRLQDVRKQYPANSAGASVLAMLRHECRGVREALQHATQVGPWLAAGPLVPGMHVRATDTVLRVGNAAGEAHPLIGEGMTMALHSAWLLCHILNAASTQLPRWQAEAAREYAAQWAHQFQRRLRIASAFAHLAMQPLCATALAALLGTCPSLLTRAARWAGKADSAPPAYPYPYREELWTPH